MKSRSSGRHRFAFLGLILLLSGIGLLGAGSPSAEAPQESPGAASAHSASETPSALYDEGRSLFQQQLYHAALDAFETLRNKAPDWRPREGESWRLAAQLRWAQENPDTHDLDALLLQARLFLQQKEMDRPGARVATEIVRIQGANSDGGRTFNDAAAYWETQPIDEESTTAYTALLEAALGDRTRWVTADRSYLRMWRNLFRAPAPRDVLFSLAERLLSGRTPTPIRYTAEQAPALSEELEVRQEIARDVLKLSPQDALAARCHLVLAVAEETLRHYEEAVRQAQLAADLGETKTDDARAAHEILNRLVEPEADLSGAQLYRPGSFHSLHLQWRNLREWRLELRRIDPRKDLLPLTDWDPQVSSRSLGPRYRDGAGTLVYELERRDKEEIAAREGAAESHVPRDTTVVLEPLRVGLYWAVLRGSRLPSSASGASDSTSNNGESQPVVSHLLIQVTDLGLLAVPMASGEIEFWLTKMDGSSLSGTTELLVRRFFMTQGRKWSSGESKLQLDGDGLGRIKALPDVHYQQQILAVGELRGHPVVFSAPVYVGSPSSQEPYEWRGFILTDRPLYRPSETVHLQALLRRANLPERSLELPKPRSVELVVRAPDGSEVLHETRTLDANGALETLFPLAARPVLGAYSVQVRSGGTGLCYGSFQVDEYRLPEFRVKVELDHERRFVLGDTLKVKVSAEYLFGGAVWGSAEVVVRRSPYYQIWRPMPFYLQGQTDRALRPWPGYAPGQEVLRETLSLNEKGEAELTLPSEAPAEAPNGRFEYSIEARVTDASRREETNTARLRVGAQEVYASLAPKLYIVAPGDSAKVRVHVEDLMGRPAAITGVCSLWLPGKNASMERLYDQDLTVDERGEAWFTFVANKPGQYAVRFAAKDTRGNAVQAETTVYCADPREKLLVGGGTGLTLIAQQDAFLGDVARVLLVSERPGISVHLTQSFGTETTSEVVRLRGNARLLEIPLDASHRPYFNLRAVTAWDYRFQEATLRVESPAKERFLKLKLAFDSTDYQPGDTAHLRVKATDLEGQPVRTSFTVAVVDDAILQLVPRPPIDLNTILQSFPVRGLPYPTLSPQLFGSYREFVSRDEALDLAGSLEPNRRFEGSTMGGVANLKSRQDVDLAETLPESFGTAKDAAAELPKLQPSSAPSDAQPSVELRSDFRTTALWRTMVTTDDDGTAQLEVSLPDNLTTWNAWALALDAENRGGQAETETHTHKELMVRLNHPRIFREGDRFHFRATVHNERSTPIDARLHLKAEGLQLEQEEASVHVPARGQASVDLVAAVPKDAARLSLSRDDESGSVVVTPRRVKVTIEAKSSQGSDAFIRTVEVYPWGTPLRVVAAKELREGDSRQSLQLQLPAHRRDDLSRAVLTVSPSVLAACVDALPYLADYPYGCTEQTLSRFVPVLAVRAAARELGVSTSRFDPKLDEKIAQGLSRIASMQRPDGGWGWWSQDESQPYLTAYALLALAQAEKSGQTVAPLVMQRGRDRLRQLLPSLENNPDDLAYVLHALAEVDWTGTVPGTRAKALNEDETMARFAQLLFEERDSLRDYARALLASYLQRSGHHEQALLVLAKLRESVQRDQKYGTAHWGRKRGYWWRGDGAVEATSFALQALLELEPVDPLTRASARWLMANREGERWDSTRASAHAIFALCAFARAQGETDPSFTLSARVGQEEVLRIKVTRDNLLDAGGSWPIDVSALQRAGGRVDLSLKGSGSAYASLSFDTWTAQERPAVTENWLSVRREYARLVPQRTLGGSVILREEPLEDGAQVKSGDRLRVCLKLNAHRELDYVAVEDPRPAGCEVVERLSGWFANGGLSGRREVRDEGNVFFLSHLSEGEHEFTYELRAESPGTFKVPVARIFGMYLPDLSGSSQSFHLGIESAAAPR